MNAGARQLTALALASTALAAGCGDGSDSMDRRLGATGDPEVRIAVADPDSYRVFQPYIAEQLGFLAEDRVSLRLIDAGNEEAALDTVKAGDADLALVGAPAVIRSLAAGEKLRMVYEAAPGGEVQIQVPCGDCTTRASVRFSHFSELEGHTLGIAPGQRSEEYLALAQARTGLAPDAIKTKTIDGPEEARKAFAVGAIDAYLSPEELLDGATESTSLTPVSVPSGLFVSTDAALEGRRGLLARALRSWSRTSYAAMLNVSVTNALPDRLEGRDAVDDAIADASAPGSGEPAYGETGYTGRPEGYAYSRIEPVGSDLFGRFERVQLRVLAATMHEAGMIARVPRMSRAVDDRLIAPANRFDRARTYCRTRRWQKRNVGTKNMKRCSIEHSR